MARICTEQRETLVHQRLNDLNSVDIFHVSHCDSGAADVVFPSAALYLHVSFKVRSPAAAAATTTSEGCFNHRI